MKRWLAWLLALVLILGMLPALSSAEAASGREALWEQIKAVEEAAAAVRGVSTVEARTRIYADNLDAIAALVEASPAYEADSLLRYPECLFWTTADGVVNAYIPRTRAETRNLRQGSPLRGETRGSGFKAGLNCRDVTVFQPFLGVDPDFTDHYQIQGGRLAALLGGSNYLYNAQLSTIDNLAYALMEAGIVMIDSHGAYIEELRANYICLTNGDGITGSDQTWVDGPGGRYPHAANSGDIWIVDGTALRNHMNKQAPNSFLWNGVCNGMTEENIFKPLRAQGVGVVLGYSEAVTFAADREWLTAFTDKLAAGENVKTAVAYMKRTVGCPDPYSGSNPAYPLVVSAYDAYPGSANRNRNQTVQSPWTPDDIGDPSVSKPVITAQPESVSVELGKNTSFRVSATGSGLSWQWQYRYAGESVWHNWAGKTEASLTVTGKTSNKGCSYRCAVTNRGGTVRSAAAVLTVTEPAVQPAVTTQPKSVSAALGQTVSMKVAATGGSLKYQWQYCYAGQSVWHDWSGKTSATLSITGNNTNNGCSYRCVISNSAGSVTSSSAMLTVTNVKPAICRNPASVSVDIGKNTGFQVSAAGSGLKYQWQYRYPDESAWIDWAGKTEASLTVTGKTANNGCSYRCVVSNAYGSAASEAALLTVIGAVLKPEITAQPRSSVTALGAKTSFTVRAEGTGMSYQWQYRLPGDSGWSKWNGQTEPCLVVTAKSSNNGCQYRCRISNEAGSVISEAATLTVVSGHDCPGKEFTDMPDCGTVEHSAIDWAIETGVTEGTTASTFSPNKSVNRGQAVTFIWRAAGCPEPSSSYNPFTDVSAKSYCYKAVLWAVEYGLTKGTTATTFSPKKTCTRGQILTFLWRASGSYQYSSVEVPYTDVKAGAYYDWAMRWAYWHRIDCGVSPTKFAPNADCTRLSTVLFLYRVVTGQGLVE